MMLIHGKSHLGCGGTEKQDSVLKEKWETKQTNRKSSWWTERQWQGITFSLPEFPHVSISHLFSAFCAFYLLNTSSPVSSTGNNDSLENIYLVKVSKSHAVEGCEKAQGAEDAVSFFWDVKIIQLCSQTNVCSTKNGNESSLHLNTKLILIRLTFSDL